MTKFIIESQISGLVAGEYEGNTREEALDAFARDAGYESFADACKITGEDGSDLLTTEVK